MGMHIHIYIHIHRARGARVRRWGGGVGGGSGGGANGGGGGSGGEGGARAEAARAEAVRTHLIQIGTRLRLTIAAEESRVLEKRLRRHDGRRASRPQASLHIVERRDAAIRDDRYADGVDLSK